MYLVVVCEDLLVDEEAEFGREADEVAGAFRELEEVLGFGDEAFDRGAFGGWCVGLSGHVDSSGGRNCSVWCSRLADREGAASGCCDDILEKQTQIRLRSRV